MNTVYLTIQSLPDEAAIKRAGLDPIETSLSLRDRNTSDRDWPLFMPADVSLLSVRPDEVDGFRFSLKTLSRSELSEADLLTALEPWLGEASEIVTVGGGDVGPTLLAMAVARSGVSCPHVAGLALPPAHRGGEHVLCMDEICAGGAPTWVGFDTVCAGLYIPSAGVDSGSSIPLAGPDLWAARRRHGEIQAVSMWLARMAWRAARMGEPGAMPAAIAALDAMIFYDRGDLWHLQRFTTGKLPFVGSLPLELIF